MKIYNTPGSENKFLIKLIPFSFMLICLQSFAQNEDVKLDKLPAAGTYGVNIEGKPILNVTNDSNAINIEVAKNIKTDKYHEPIYYPSKLGSCLTDNSQFEHMIYTMKFQFIKGGGNASIGIIFHGEGYKSEGFRVNKKGEVFTIRDEDSKHPYKGGIIYTKGINTLQIIKGNTYIWNKPGWQCILNNKLTAEFNDQEKFLINGKDNGQLIFTAGETIKIESITQEFKDGSLGVDNPIVVDTTPIVEEVVIPRDLEYYHGDYVMHSSCDKVFPDFKLNVYTYRIGDHMYVELKGIPGLSGAINIQEIKPKVYQAQPGIAFIATLKEEGTEIYINNRKYYFIDFVLEAGIVKFRLYYEEFADQSYAGDKTTDNYKVLDCYFYSK